MARQKNDFEYRRDDDDGGSDDGRRMDDDDGAPGDFDGQGPYYDKESDAGGGRHAGRNRDRQVAIGGGAGSYTGPHDDEEAVDLDDDGARDDFYRLDDSDHLNGTPRDLDRHEGDSGDGRPGDDDDGA